MFRILRVAPAALLIGLGLLAACGGAEGDAEAQSTAQTQTAEESAPTPPPSADQEPQDLAAAHILIMYQGSQRAPETVTRSKEEALALAEEIVRKLRDGADFAEMAKEYSDGPSAPRGGDLGTWPRGRMVPEFEAAVLAMDVGDVSAPVETAYGYHVIQRKKVEKVSARHILVMHQDSMRKPPEITRTKEEALERIHEVQQKLADGQSFEDLAREYSDGPTSVRGGDLGSFGKGMMAPAFEKAAFGLEVGEVSDVVETPFGYHLIQRYE